MGATFWSSPELFLLNHEYVGLPISSPFLECINTWPLWATVEEEGTDGLPDL